ncbi:hypothetical protein, partial [Propionivibrio sp.]|uniref:hypothetical protein n=1 Tax=Propionivibrio sp. TaxID=2212460 RepID=UPI003BEFFB3F
ESYSLAQMTDVESMRRAVADLRALARATRLASEKMVSGRKEQLRLEIVQAGRTALQQHVTALDLRLGGKYMPIIGADFATAIKGKKNIDSIQDAVNTMLASAKIEASAAADRIQSNLKVIADNKEYAFLFFDLAQLVLKNPDDLAAVVSSRITEHKVKQEAERMRIASEERAKAEAAAAVTIAKAQPKMFMHGNLPVSLEQFDKTYPIKQKPVLPTLKLGTIAERLGFGLTADFLSTLGFEPARVKSAALYHESQFDDICKALVDHINSVCALQVAQL